MGRVAAVVLVLGLFVGPVVGVVTAPAPPAHASRGMPMFRIAVVGDSYTTGSNEGGTGANAWPIKAWQLLSRQGVDVVGDVAAEGGAGYGVPGNHGNVFEQLAVNVVRPDDALVLFYGSRNDQGVDPATYFGDALSALNIARRAAPSAPLLVIGPPWPTADVPPAVLSIRDALAADARAVGAAFVDPIAERWFVGRPELIGADGVHPTDAGHVYMAHKIAPLVAAHLPRV